MSPLELADRIVQLKPVDKGPDTRWEIWLISASGSLIRYLSETYDHRAAQNLRKGRKARSFVLLYSCIIQRIYKGWSDQEVIETPAGKRRPL